MPVFGILFSLDKIRKYYLVLYFAFDVEDWQYLVFYFVNKLNKLYVFDILFVSFKLVNYPSLTLTASRPGKVVITKLVIYLSMYDFSDNYRCDPMER